LPRVRLLLALAVTALVLSGCFGTGSGGRSRPGTTSEPGGSPTSSACGDAADATLDLQGPGHYRLAAANERDGAGQRTVRWDLRVEDACQATDATARVQAATGPPPQDCPEVALRASVTTGLTEAEVPLSGDAVRSGQATFRPARPDLASGPGTFIVSLAASLASTGVEVRDHECLEATLHSLHLEAGYARAWAA
jgi:hypothetical protein